MKRIKCLSINHKIAPVQVREKICMDAAELGRLMHKGSEIYVLSTCNRAELYWVGIDDETVYDFFCRTSGLDRAQITENSSLLSGPAALEHLFAVTSGLNSLVIGESQILGQVKEAYRQAAAAGTTATYLNKALHKAFKAAKRIHTETDLGKYPVSVASEAVELASHIFGDISKSRVLVIGAGNMAEIAARRLKDRGVNRLYITNRTAATAAGLADELGGEAVAFENLPDALRQSDIVISSTGADQPIISGKLMQSVMRARKNRPIILIDIAVPRDIEDAAGEIYNCYLYDIDALKSIVDRHSISRKNQMDKARQIIDQEVEAYDVWLKSLNSSDTIRQLYDMAEEYTRDELQNLPPDEAEIVARSLRSVTRRLLHRPVSFLKDFPEDQHIEFIRRMFQLDEDYQDRHKRKPACHGSDRDGLPATAGRQSRVKD